MRVVLDLLYEFANTRVFGLFHNTMWQSRYSEVNVYFFALCEQTDGLFTFNGYLDLHLRFCLCLCLSLNVQQTNWYSRSHERNVYRFLEHSNGTFVLSQRVSPFYKLDWGLVGLVGSLLFVEQLLNPIPLSNHVTRKSSEAVEVIQKLFSI